MNHPHPKSEASSSSCAGGTRRDFITLTGTAMAAVGACSVAWPFIHSMNPSADVLALASTEVDLAPIQVGQTVKVMWRGKPVFVRRRTPEEIARATQDDTAPDLKDPQKDADRVAKGHEEWLVTVAVCTHLGCVPLGHDDAGFKGQFGGWFCPCHGSDYDTSGRIRKGPAPQNLVVPPVKFVSNTQIVIGGQEGKA